MTGRQGMKRTSRSHNRQVILPRVRRFLNTVRDSLKIPTAAEIDVLKRRVNELEKKIPR